VAAACLDRGKAGIGEQLALAVTDPPTAAARCSTRLLRRVCCNCRRCWPKPCPRRGHRGRKRVMPGRCLDDHRCGARCRGFVRCLRDHPPGSSRELPINSTAWPCGSGPAGQL
jgi:hypothetical protein